MHRGTTPTLDFIFPFSVDRINKLNLTLAQRGEVLVEKHLDSEDVILNDKTLSVILSQEETMRFSPHLDIEAQIRLKVGTTVLSTRIYKIKAREILEEEIL